MSDIGASMMAMALAPGEFAGLIVSQVPPSPTSRSLPLTAAYNTLVAKAGANPTYSGLEGFLYARVIATAIGRCTRELTRRCLSSALEASPIEVGAYPIRFSPTDHRGSGFVEMTLVTSEGRCRR